MRREGSRSNSELRRRLGTGEKLVNFVRAANTHPEFARELPNFVAEVKVIFSPSELRLYFDTVKRVGVEGHVMTDEEYRLMRDAGALDTSVVRGAEDVIIVARIREMLLEESAN
jgi:hypothetical protein